MVDDGAFIRLMKAYKTILAFFDNQENREVANLDEEDSIIKNLFKDFNFAKQNSSSFTIIIENELS